MQNKYRHELKYLVDERDLVLLENKLTGLIKTDKYYENGAYEIRSAYFDDYKDTALKQNIMGVSPRFKYRIRIYNGDDSYIHLEKKIKNHDMTRKESCNLSYEECQRLLDGQYQIQPQDEDFLKQFKAYAAMNLLKPKVVVAYERKAFICPEGNVRITFDRNISAATEIGQFFDKDIGKRPIMPSGKHVLEVKYDEFMPRYIKAALNTGKLDRTTFSKYYLCRKYSIGT